MSFGGYMITFVKVFNLDGSFKWTFEGYEVIFSFDQPTYRFHAQQMVFSITSKQRIEEGLEGVWYGNTLHSADGVHIGQIYDSSQEKFRARYYSDSSPVDVVSFPPDEPALQFFSLTKGVKGIEAVKLLEYLDIKESN